MYARNLPHLLLKRLGHAILGNVRADKQVNKAFVDWNTLENLKRNAENVEKIKTSVNPY